MMTLFWMPLLLLLEPPAVRRGASTRSAQGVTRFPLPHLPLPSSAPPSQVSELVARNNGFCLGSPTLGGHMPTPVQEALGTILQDTDAKGKPCGVFGSFGWSGEAIDMMHSALKVRRSSRRRLMCPFLSANFQTSSSVIIRKPNFSPPKLMRLYHRTADSVSPLTPSGASSSPR